MEVEQGVHLRIDDEDDAAAPAAISAIGAAQRLEFLAMDRSAAVTARTRSGVDDDPIDKPRHRAPLHLRSVQLLRVLPLVNLRSGRTRATLRQWSNRRCSPSYVRV
ncbi:Uncharacterised protein [Mycobacterium tuberculosis]|uniref:Uncharacterized protein n=1 Tax=Mycobacterium tuberculosis TaxID=1773 RepID=A0A655ISS9_MYCTX|nr:Uncharacterised protein [Mycobacterium tuberculosis]CKT54753.1 Uncharacterised protein [Mycobacterium tuberculosis]CKV71252.1 Uncharacterised protein [Mycobacterium tuberculosis]COW14746.1 Uncharacterised protein [Mycobacterium tuberculosis]